MQNFFLKVHTARKNALARLPMPIISLFKHLWETFGILVVGYILLNFFLAVTAYFVSGQVIYDLASLMAGSCQTGGLCDFATLYAAVAAWLVTGFYLIVTIVMILWRWFYLAPITTADLAAEIAVIQHQLDEEVLPRLRGL